MINVLVCGNAGCREFVLTQLARRSDLVNEVHTFCDNAGTRLMDDVVVAKMPDNHSGIVDYCQKESIDLVIIGPEQLLVDGLADVLRKAGILVFGPGASGAQLEGSKLWGRKFCLRHGISVPDFKQYRSLSGALSGLRSWKQEKVVIKYNGLAGGKGVSIHEDKEEAEAKLRELFAKDGSGLVLLEEYLPDHPAWPRSEVSVFAAVSGSSYKILDQPIQDYKSRFEDDKGPMTGGMGCFGPVPGVDMESIERDIIAPTVAGLAAENIDYRGVIYFSLKLCQHGIYVVEFNVRFGDPEMSVLHRLIASDLIPLMLDTAQGRDISDYRVQLFDGAAVCVVVVGKNYPTSKTPLQMLSKHLRGPMVDHAATGLLNARITADGGRIVGICSRGSTIGDARDTVYRFIHQGYLCNLTVRPDIAKEW